MTKLKFRTKSINSEEDSNFVVASLHTTSKRCQNGMLSDEIFFSCRLVTSVKTDLRPSHALFLSPHKFEYI